MKGYLLAEKTVTPGDNSFIDSVSSENNFAVVFEDDTSTGYFYAVEMTPETGGQRILDALHIYNVEEVVEDGPLAVKIIWSRDWLKCALVVNAQCHALFDFEHQRGYSVNEFPDPNPIWTKGDRKITNQIIADIFG
ncbi:DUF2251 domain-containing protein [Paraflavitalea pollutisoli]|uniref:DUF2251 domain-containing protein n=1 Tax=Paraflavitalea pollutisoli TaxID=3034143 RepID=UPI0023ECC4F4|nr:DUF2251 domain-containing protein [Paraflavitalea sp. H1-2-19X]